MSFFNPYMKGPDYGQGMQGIISQLMQLLMMGKMFPGQQQQPQTPQQTAEAAGHAGGQIAPQPDAARLAQTIMPQQQGMTGLQGMGQPMMPQGGGMDQLQGMPNISPEMLQQIIRMLGMGQFGR